MHILVTGRTGQLVTALAEAGPAAGITVTACGRPELDLEQPAGVRDAIMAHAPDLVVNAAAWTAVDQAETEPERARLANVDGAAAVAQAAAALGVPLIHVSTDYVFSGDLDRPYTEDDATGPTGVYGRTKLDGEAAVAAALADHAILRTAWVYSATGRNFLRTMLKLAETRDEVGVVADQFGTPTSADDLAAGILRVGANLLRAPGQANLRGVFHLSASGDTASWADFAQAIFAGLARRGGRSVAVRRLATSDYPTPTRRPANSRLDCSRIARLHGVVLPDWRDGVERCLDRLIGPPRGA